MHELSIPADLVERVIARAGRPHPFDVIEPAKTAFVVVDMQNYFVKPGFQGEVPKARAIVPAVNRLAAAVRELGGHVVWIKNATNDTRESWSVFHDWLQTPQRRDRRYGTMDTAHEGHALWAGLVSLALYQVAWLRTVARWGPLVIEGLAIFFVGQVVIRLGYLEIERRMLPREGLEDNERRRRATMVPLVRSTFMYAAYFTTAVLILAALVIQLASMLLKRS